MTEPTPQKTVWTADKIRSLGVRTDLETAASIWGIGRTRAYELANAGEFPSPVLRLGSRWVALVTPMLRALGVEGDLTTATNPRSDDDQSARPGEVATPPGVLTFRARAQADR